MRAAPILAVLVAVLLVASQTLFTVDQRQWAMVFQLGEVVSVKQDPGLYFKVPLLQNVKYFEKRILTLDVPEAERFITSEKKNVLVDSFVKWRIVDVLQYYRSVGGDEEQAKRRLAQTVNSNLREEFGKRTIHDVVSGERNSVMEIMRDKANQDAQKIGVEVMDVRLKRVDLPQEVSESVYRRMDAERKRVANELRSQGAAESERIRADADRQREVILADAYKRAQQIKGEGDAKSAAIYSKAYGQNAEFYAFYRSLEAYRASFRSKSDVLVLEPGTDFFRYLRQPSSSRPAK
jgi:membrane protease subunit HflC